MSLVILSLAIACAMVSPFRSAIAQTEHEEFESSLSGVVVQVAGDEWEASPFDNSTEGTDILRFENPTSLGVVMFVESGDEPSAFIDRFLQSVESPGPVVARDEGQDASTVAFFADHDSASVGNVLRVTSDFVSGYSLVEFLSTEIGQLADQIQSAQQSVTIGRATFFEDLDSQAYADAFAQGTGAGTGTPESGGTGGLPGSVVRTPPDNPANEPTAAPTALPTDVPVSTPDVSAPPTRASAPEPTRSSTKLSPALRDLGLLSLSEYQSPNFGLTVEWGPSYKVDLLSEDSLTASATEGDSITLTSTSQSGLLSLTFIPGSSTVIQNWVDTWTRNITTNSSVSRSSVLFDQTTDTRSLFVAQVALNDGTAFVLAFEASCANPDCSIVLLAQLQGLPVGIGDMYNDARADVVVDGAPPFDVLTEQEFGNLFS